MKLLHLLLLVLLSTFGLPALAAPDDAIRAAAERHVRQQARGLPGEVGIQVGALDPNTRLPDCSRLEAYTPSGTRLWGRAHVGVRCLAPHPWNILLPVYISISGPYLVTARPLTAGTILQDDDLLIQRGDLTALPAGIVTDIASATGKSLKNSLAAGQLLRSDLLLAPLLIRQGQSVRLIVQGVGFTATSEGRALGNAAAGQVVQVRVASGRTISGIVLPDGSVEVSR